MLIVPQAMLEQQGDEVCCQLQERGLTPVRLSFTEDQGVLIIFNLAPEGRTPWYKGFTRPRAEARPDAYLHDLAEWKAKVVREIRDGSPSETVRNAIGLYSRQGVLDMMGAVQ